MASKGGTESPFSWRWTSVTWRVLNFPCRFAVGYQLEDRNVGKNPISHSISCPVREIQPRTGTTLQETLVGESASISLCTTWWLPHLLHQVKQDFFPPLLTWISVIPSIEAPIYRATDSLGMIESRLDYISCVHTYIQGKFGKKSLEW